MIDSNLGGTCQPLPGQANENHQADPDTGVPLADEEPQQQQPPPPPQQQQPPPPPEAKEVNDEDPLEELNRAFAELSVTNPSDEMRAKVLLIPDIPVRYDVSNNRDILVAQIVLPPGAVLSSLTIKPDTEDPNLVNAAVDIDPHVSNAEFRIKSFWVEGNPLLASVMQAGIDASCKRDVVPGSNHERVK